MIAIADRRGTFLRLAFGLAGAGVLLFVARSVTIAASNPAGFHIPMMAIAVMFAPIGIYLAFRYPLIFPFGLYLVLVPFDAILTISSGATLVRLVAGLAGVALLARMLMLRRFVKPHAGWYAWAAFVAWAGISLMWTPDLPESQRVFTIVIQNFLMMTVLALYPVREFEFRWLCVLAVAAGMFAAIYVFTHHQMLGGRLTVGTASGLAVDPNAFATSFVLPIALCLAVALSSKNLRVRLLCGACVVFMMAPVLMTGSRGGVVAMVLLFAYFAWRSPQRLQILGIAAICVALTAFFPSVIDRFIHDEGQAGSGSGRTYIWAVGVHAIKQHWFAGTGIGSFLDTYDRNFLSVFQAKIQGWHRPSHDIIIGTWVELGLIGLALVLSAWYATFRQMRAITKTSSLFPARIALEAALVALFAQALFIDPIWIKYIWLAQSIPLLLLNVQTMSTQTEPEGSTILPRAGDVPLTRPRLIWTQNQAR